VNSASTTKIAINVLLHGNPTTRYPQDYYAPAQTEDS